MPYRSLLERIEIFADLDTDRLGQISKICTERRYKKGDLIFHANTKSDDLYVILQGQVEIQVDPSTLGIFGRRTSRPDHHRHLADGAVIR